VVTAIWAFLQTPWGRGLATVAAVVLGAFALLAWDRARIASKVEAAASEATAICNASWREKLKATEDAARDTIRRKEAAAYQRAVEDERARAEANAEEVAKAETVITRVETVSAPARDCKLDKATADALNELRGE
jgi:hypothetical protein